MPTTECWGDKRLEKARGDLTKKVLMEIEGNLKGRSVGSMGHSGISRPFSIDDLIEDEFEYLEMLKEDIVMLGEF